MITCLIFIGLMFYIVKLVFQIIWEIVEGIFYLIFK